MNREKCKDTLGAMESPMNAAGVYPGYPTMESREFYVGDSSIGGVSVIEIAAMAYNLNRLYCAQALGDLSQPEWGQAPHWLRESAIAGVCAILNDDVLCARDNHAGWLEKKLRDGWRYGPEKDPTEKTHPCLLPWRSLPVDQQVKDEIFFGFVNALRSALRGGGC